VPTNGVHHDQQDVSAIEQRRLGASGIEVRAVGIGTQQWGSKSWGYGKSYTRDDHEARTPAMIAAVAAPPQARSGSRQRLARRSIVIG
jgi:hypothetical protein